MSGDRSQDVFRLKRRHLSIYVDSDGDVYLADVESSSARVYVMSSEAFTQAVRDRHIVARHWSVVVARKDCLLKTVFLPADDAGQARRMLAFEVPTLVPMQEAQLSYDFVSLPGIREGQRSYLVFLVPLDRLERAARPLRSAGIEPDVIVPSSVALLGWLRSCQSIEDRLAPFDTDDVTQQTLMLKHFYFASIRPNAS